MRLNDTGDNIFLAKPKSKHVCSLFTTYRGMCCKNSTHSIPTLNLHDNYWDFQMIHLIRPMTFWL
jgi:hypothetical protein